MVGFWDTSAVVPLVIAEPLSEWAVNRLARDRGLVAWWGTLVECRSAIARREREGQIDRDAVAEARARLASLSQVWHEVGPTGELRALAGALLDRYPLRAADALQLAAALIWSERAPPGRIFLTNDARLLAAARSEGFEALDLG